MAATPRPLDAFLDAERAREAARAAAHAREQARGRGVAWSGLGPGPFRPRSESELIADAAAIRDDLAAWSATPSGRYLFAIGALQNAADQARACHARGLSRAEAERAANHLAEAADALGLTLEALHELAEPYLRDGA